MARTPSRRGPAQHAPPEHGVEDRLQRLERLLEQLVAGMNPAAAAKEEEPPMAPDEPEWGVGLAPNVRDALRRMPEPRRQRKQRHVAPRKVYRVRQNTTSAQLRALQSLTPAAMQIFVYLAQHPAGATVPDLVTQLDLRRKTVENLVSTLRAHNLLDE